MSKKEKKYDLLDSFKGYYSGTESLSEEALNLIDKTVSSIASINEGYSPGFCTFFGFQEHDDFVLDFGERFWNEKILRGGLKLICEQEDDDAVRATLWFLAEQFNNAYYITNDVKKAKSVLDKICEVLSEGEMIHIANPEFRRNRVISRTGKFTREGAEALFDKRFMRESNKASALATVLLELESVNEVRYYELVGKITPFYAHLKAVVTSPGDPEAGDTASTASGNETHIEKDGYEDGDFGAAKFSPGAENLINNLSDMIADEPVKNNRVFCPFRTKQILKDVMREAGMELDVVAAEALRRLDINDLNAFMLTIILKDERQGPVGKEAVTRICELLGIKSTRYYEHVNRFQAVMSGLKEDERYASEESELIEIVKMFYNVYRRICVYEPAA